MPRSRAPQGLAEQRRLADAGSAAHHQRPALIGDAVKQLAEQPELGFAPEQRRDCGHDVIHSM
jgi:hypothetical protein